MYIRTTKTRKDGKEVRYLSLAESVRVPGIKNAGKRIIHNFGPESSAVRTKLENLIVNIQRYLLESGGELALQSVEGVKVETAYN